MIPKWLAIVLIAVLFCNMTLFALGMVGEFVFWGVIIFGALVAYGHEYLFD